MGAVLLTLKLALLCAAPMLRWGWLMTCEPVAEAADSGAGAGAGDAPRGEMGRRLALPPAAAANRSPPPTPRRVGDARRSRSPPPPSSRSEAARPSASPSPSAVLVTDARRLDAALPRRPRNDASDPARCSDEEGGPLPPPRIWASSSSLYVAKRPASGSGRRAPNAKRGLPEEEEAEPPCTCTAAEGAEGWRGEGVEERLAMPAATAAAAAADVAHPLPLPLPEGEGVGVGGGVERPPANGPALGGRQPERWFGGSDGIKKESSTSVEAALPLPLPLLLALGDWRKLPLRPLGGCWRLLRAVLGREGTHTNTVEEDDGSSPAALFTAAGGGRAVLSRWAKESGPSSAPSSS